jgi:microcompartment protein CcmK/EutM
MFIAEVIAPVVSTVKHEFFDGRKLLLVRERALDGTLAAKPVIALDGVQAGVGDTVLVAKNGGAVDDVTETKEGPANVIIIGIIDRVTTAE